MNWCRTAWRLQQLKVNCCFTILAFFLHLHSISWNSVVAYRERRKASIHVLP